MLERDEIIDRLKDMNLSAVARGAKINYGTLHHFFKNKDSNVSYETVRKLSNYLQEGDRGKDKA